MPSFVIKDAPSGARGRRQVFTLDKPITSIGAAPDNDITLASAALDDHHAVVVFDGVSFQIQGGKRTSSLHINGKRKKKHTLRHQDTVGVGEAQFTFNMLDGAPGDEQERAKLAFELAGYRRLQSFSGRLLEEYEVETLLEQIDARRVAQ